MSFKCLESMIESIAYTIYQAMHTLHVRYIFIQILTFSLGYFGILHHAHAMLYSREEFLEFTLIFYCEQQTDLT